MTEEQKAELKKLSAEAAALANSVTVKTDGERFILNLLRRAIETIMDGKPTTHPLSRHHV